MLALVFLLITAQASEFTVTESLNLWRNTFASENGLRFVRMFPSLTTGDMQTFNNGSLLSYTSRSMFGVSYTIHLTKSEKVLQMETSIVPINLVTRRSFLKQDDKIVAIIDESNIAGSISVKIYDDNATIATSYSGIGFWGFIPITNWNVKIEQPHHIVADQGVFGAIIGNTMMRNTKFYLDGIHLLALVISVVFVGLVSILFCLKKN